MKKYLSIFLSGLLLASCMDSDIIPYGQTVEQDYWKTKSNVAQVVTRAYSGMANANVVQRLIVWGDFRSDELILNTEVLATNTTRRELAQIETANVEPTNSFCTWGDFYSVINYCNLCIEKAPEVVEADPDYLQGDCNLDVVQMKALRSLCYFYLVRAFRDVPYITTAYRNSSQEMNVPQSAPSVVLQGCIDDLEAAAKDIYDAKNFALGAWESRGYLNRDAVYAILADIYLWRASVLHGSNPAQAQADYQKCADYCDLVIASKNEYHSSTLRPGMVVDPDNAYPALGSIETFFGDLFTNQGVTARQLNAQQNAEESIFEIEFGGNNIGLKNMYYSYDNNNSHRGYMLAPSIFGSYGNNYVFTSSLDVRKKSIYFTASGADNYDVRKLITDTDNFSDPSTATYARETGLSTIAHNMILYRMTDVMLMKAEALTQLASFVEGQTTGDVVDAGESADEQEAGDGDADEEAGEEPANSAQSLLEQAFELVKAVNDRALYEASSSTAPHLDYANYNNVTAMENLVLAERLRELCFEGKRWYDLLRYNYRQNAKKGINTNYDTILADMAAFVPNNDDALMLMTRTLSEPSTVMSKMPTEPHLYMPISKEEMDLNLALKQNPVYDTSDEYIRAQ